MTNDGSHTYTYDAEGNIVSVDAGNTGQYVYDALNHRVRTQTASGTYEFLFDAAGQRTSTWQTSDNFGIEGRIYWDGKQIAYRGLDGSTYFDHQDWLGTERLRSSYTGSVAATFTSLPFADGYAASISSTEGGQDNAQYALLDYDSESNTSHAQYRQYNSTQGRWMRPDPYSGSYSLTNPQSFNRYAYALNNPLGFIDPSGLAVTCDYADYYLSGVDNNGVIYSETDETTYCDTLGADSAGGAVSSSSESSTGGGEAEASPNANPSTSCSEKLAHINYLVDSVRVNPREYKGIAQRFRQLKNPKYADAGHLEQLDNKQRQLQKALDDYKKDCGDPPGSATGYATMPIPSISPGGSSSSYSTGTVVVLVGGTIVVVGVAILCPICLVGAAAI